MDPRQDYIQTRHFRSASHNLSLPVEHEVTTSSAGPAGLTLTLFGTQFKYKDFFYVSKICQADAAPIN